MSEESFLLLPPEEIEGIGPMRAAALRDVGITTIGELFGAGAQRVHTLCPTAGVREVGEWFCKAMLLRVKGVTPHLAEAFVKAGLRSVKKVAYADLGDLETAVQKSRLTARQHLAPTLYELSNIQKAAWRLAAFGMLAGRLLYRNGHPVRNALVDIGDQETRTDKNGWYVFDKIRAGQVHMRVDIEGRPLPFEIRPIRVSEGKLTGPVHYRLSPSPQRRFNLTLVRESDGNLIANTRGTRIELVWRPLNEFADGALLQVRHLGDDGYSRLLCYFKERVGRVIYIPRARIKIEDLPRNANVGDMLRYTDGRLEATNLTRRDVAELKRQRWKASARRTTRRVIRVIRMGNN